MSRPILSLLLIAGSLLNVIAAPVRAATEEEIDAARKKGMQYLLDSQAADGSWDYKGHVVGITALCAIALIENGIPVDDPAIQKAERYILNNYLDTTSTYDIALAILLLNRVGDRDNKSAIRDLAARLVAGQNTHGGWGYSCPKVRSIYLSGGGERPSPPSGPGDNSCTQFAVLGLWVASRSGVNIDDTMVQVAYRFVQDQNEDGGWPYKADPAMPQGSRNSMTFAGLFCLTVARANRIRSIQQAEADGKPLPKLPPARVRPAVEPSATPAADPNAAADAAEAAPAPAPTPTPARVAVPTGPVVDPGADVRTLHEDPVWSRGFALAAKYAGGVGPGASRYFMWSVERMGVILGLEKFGTVDWFDRGATALLASQGKPAGENEAIEGAWQIASTGSALSETSFAILFLRKANLGSDITRLLEGEPADPFQIVSQENKPRFLKFDQAIKAARPGDVIRIDSSRPIEVPHLEIDKDLTIEAGFGYTPVLRYDVGFDAQGRRSDPKTDPTARYMFAVKSGTLTLEGFRLQLDPPKAIGTVAWMGISVENGGLRLLNCSISEGSRQGMACISVTGPGRVEARNCVLVGGRAAVEIAPAGAQEIVLHNSVLFSNVGISVIPGKSPGDRLQVELSRCAVQAPEAFAITEGKTPIEFRSYGVAYLAEALGSNFLRARSGTQDLKWSGSHNLYDVKKWVGFQNAPIATIKDAKSWSTFWGGADESGDSRIITFAGKRRQGAFTLDVAAEDFEFASTSQVYGSRRRTGVNPIYCGPGYNFTLYREGFEYSAWKEAEEAMAAAR